MSDEHEGSPYQIQTFVFFDLETLGFDDKPRILELSMIAVSRSDLLYMKEENFFSAEKLQSLPRVLHKYTQLYYPRKLIKPTIEEITGLSNYNLNHLPPFQADNATAINLFFKHLPSPVCMVAHNGLAFDFPILKAELLGVNSGGLTGIVCADSLIYIRRFEKDDIKEITEIAKNFNDSDFEDIVPLTNLHLNGHSEVLNGGPSCSKEIVTNSPDIIKRMYETPKKAIRINSTPPSLKRKASSFLNEHTPEHNLNHNRRDNSNGLHNSNARKALFQEKSTILKMPFSQPTLYHRIFGINYKAHCAEADATALLQICAFFGQDFISWADQNFTPFQLVRPRWAARRTFTLS